MGFNGDEAGGDACVPGQAMVRPGDRTSLKKQTGTPAYTGRLRTPDGGVHRTDPLSLPLEKKGGGEKQSYLYEKLF